MSTQVNGLTIQSIQDEYGNDVSNTDEWEGFEFTIYFTNGTKLNIAKSSGYIFMELLGRINSVKGKL